MLQRGGRRPRGWRGRDGKANAERWARRTFLLSVTRTPIRVRVDRGTPSVGHGHFGSPTSQRTERSARGGIPLRRGVPTHSTPHGGTQSTGYPGDGDYTPDVPAHSTARGILVSAVVAFGVGLGGCAPLPAAEGPSSSTCPQDAATIGEAVELVAEGGMVLVDARRLPRAGRRRSTEHHGARRRPQRHRHRRRGPAPLRHRRHRRRRDASRTSPCTRPPFYGVLITGLHDENGPRRQRRRRLHDVRPRRSSRRCSASAVDHVTAYNNGLYGIYAFNAQHGVITRLLRLGLGGQRLLRRPVPRLRHPRAGQRRRTQRGRLRERQRLRTRSCSSATGSPATGSA